MLRFLGEALTPKEETEEAIVKTAIKMKPRDLATFIEALPSWAEILFYNF
ncbi:MAG: hypothetical protein KC994_21910 [Candidatus Omnitrophica bacterium]|nr:hypothetical protein [Candidatus Omnitrophota bacterium]